jgi:hypothetical protein
MREFCTSGSVGTSGRKRPGVTRQLLRFGHEFTSLVGAMRVSKPDSEYLVSFAWKITENDLRVLPIPCDRALEPYAISPTAVIWSDAQGDRKTATVLRQDLTNGEHTMGTALSAAGKASAAAVSADGGLVARAIDERVVVSRVPFDCSLVAPNLPLRGDNSP